MFLLGISRVKSPGGMKSKGKIVPVCTMNIMGVADVRYHSFLTSAPDEVSGQIRYTAALLPG